MEIIVKEDKVRVDVYLKDNTDYSRSKIKQMILDKDILVNGKVVLPSFLLKVNDVITIREKIVNESFLEEEKMDLDIVYEDDYLAIINKPSGLVVHPAVGNKSGTLANGLLYHFKKISNDKSIRPGIVHRLDKDTSGLMVVAKDDKTHELLSEMIKKKEVERIYLALVYGVVKHDRGLIDAPIGRDINNRQKYSVTNINAKDARTHFTVLERFPNATLLSLKLETGRTHQIRVHLNYINHPVVNDLVYGNRKIIDPSYGQMLHSYSIRFKHPILDKELYFVQEPDKRFSQIVDMFRN